MAPISPTKQSDRRPSTSFYVPGWSSRLDLSWEQPLDARFLKSLSSFSRLIMLDRRGIGLSDPVLRTAPPPLEVLMDDITSVLNAVDSKEAALFGEFEGGPLCTVFAATYPERTRALVLYGSYARGTWAPDYPWAWTKQQLEEDIAHAERALEHGWDEDYFRDWAESVVPSLAHDPTFTPWLRKLFGSPGVMGSVIALARLEHELDIRAVLPAVAVPTLVMNRIGDRVADFEEDDGSPSRSRMQRSLSFRVMTTLRWAGDQRLIVEAISSFLGVSRPPPEIQRVLATILFTDIVDSTSKAVALGDAAWRDLVTMSEERSRAEIERYGGKFIDATGDRDLRYLRWAGPCCPLRTGHLFFTPRYWARGSSRLSHRGG